MYKGLNSVFLTGRLRDEPVMINLDSGGKMATINLDVEYDWVDSATSAVETKIETHPIAIFNSYTIDYLEKYIKVGHSLLVEGVLQGRSYKGSDGQERFVSRVTVGKKFGKVKYIAREPKDAAASAPAKSTGNLTMNDDLPF